MSLAAPAITTATSLRRPSTSPLSPPSGPLPALPIIKTRQPLPVPPDGNESGAASYAQAAPRITRSVTMSGLPTPAKNRSTPAVPTLNTAELTPMGIASPTSSVTPSSGIPTPGKTLRKTTSIGGFPLPPKGSPRVSSLPPSPLSTATSSSDVQAAATAGQRDPTKHRSTESMGKRQKPRSSGYGARLRQSTSSVAGTCGTPSLLNGTGEDNLVSSSRASDSTLLTPPSPSQSRSSSVDGSYMTDATAFEDVGEDTTERGRPKSLETTTSSKRDSGAKDKDTKGNVLVSVRVRPDTGGAEGNSVEGEWMVDGRRSLIAYKGKEGGDYKYDNVFSPYDNNSRVYDNAAKRLVRRVMEGYNGTVFAYGMTGTGKTFSMQGTATSPGVIPLAITDIFSYIRENPDREFLLRVSYLEIYNERIYDLLNHSTSGQQSTEEIKLREDSKRGVYATPLKEEIVQSPNQLLRVIARGDIARRTSSTQFNARSSRSHAVVQIVVESRERTPSHGAYFDKDVRRTDRILPGGVLVSTLSLIDLAGSEKAAESKERRTEGAHINKSLLTLGTVIGRLSGDDDKEKEDGGKVNGADKEKSLKHLPYRDSKLTRLLQPALSGNSLVSILCTIQLSSAGTSAAAGSSHTGETLNTLKFASRAKNNIVSHAKRNESNPNGGDAGSRALLDRYRLEIQELRGQLEQQNKDKDEVEKVEEETRDRQLEEKLEREEQIRHEEQMLEMQLARTALKERISHLNRLILSSKSLGVNSGRMSSASIPVGRTSVYNNNEWGRPVSVRSRDSVHSSQRDSVRDSAATLDVPMPPEIGRAMSSGSITMGTLPAAEVSHMISEEADDDNEDDSGEVDAVGDASLAQQNRMLQADLADKNRYIATLEKRLLQARRTSRSRVSSHLSTTGLGLLEDAGSPEALLREKDRELEEMRAKLDDQMRMVTALRSAARKRDLLDNRFSQSSALTERPVSSSGVVDRSARGSSRLSTRSTRLSTVSASHRSTLSSTSRSSSGAINFSKRPLSPIAILRPSRSSSEEDGILLELGNGTGGAVKGSLRRRSVDEMTMLLDQMIQEKVESGLVLQGDRGTLRLKRDTVMEEPEGVDVTAGAQELRGPSRGGC
ncbi:hypothetical protein LTR62_003775 [Meristemomyces frigidus]|uniref:Kinesin-like protein KIP2 n=1 Tax=Meristemomyces frigidus TaxID=1508187 RepID=A0AAN7YKD8_9PEZI|nr:hypothetical protein LTR62_003775 [Meristemomyces frigidus]